ncbi:MAG: polyprenyl synthetase family protein [Chloracidobacterium sp.]|nr:polyprenyl synthetase family protein [Chloracidobacterium sp.]
MPDLDRFLVDVRLAVESALDGIVPASVEQPTRLHEAIRWSLFAGGKRVRPAIVIAVGETFAAERDVLVKTAAAVEMIHTYSLIHDDLPAMDDDDLRRGRATCHKQFDEATAILAGDVLQTLAFKNIADDAGLTTDVRVQLVSLLASASGTPDGMVAGQQLDLDAEGKGLGLDEIRSIHRRKTGALISASARAGAIIGNASEQDMIAIGEYADKLGLLFQVTDDLLDVTQSTEGLGKTAGKDRTAKKATYPSLLGIDRTMVVIETIRSEACRALDAIGRDASLLRSLAGHVAGRTK